MRSPLLFACLLVSSLSVLTICNANAGGDDETINQHPFTYTTGAPNGPEKWGHVNSSWSVCENGKIQSPINLDVKSAQVVETPVFLKRTYKPAPAKIFNRGHDIIVEWQGDAGKIEINGTSYKLIQCHWHSPSEHTIDGKRFDMETHMVHSSDDGHKAVLAVLYAFGAPNSFVQTLEEHIKVVDKTGIDLGVVDPRMISFGSGKYFRYIGSLTTPPCTEGVVWTVAEKIRPVSKEQVQLTKDALHDAFRDNSRPIQAINGRPVMIYNAMKN